MYLNKCHKTPFEIALDRKSPKSIELYLEMLMKLPEFRVSPFLKKHFDELFEMQLETFERFLDTCFF